MSSVPLDQPHEPPITQEVREPTRWEWADPVRIGRNINKDMIALIKSSTKVLHEGSMVSNDNYTGRRINFVDSEVATALALEPEAEAA